MRYLRWTGITAEIFNVGNYRWGHVNLICLFLSHPNVNRRKMNLGEVTADFFDSTNQEATSQRETLALAVQEDMYKWLHSQEGETSTLC